MKDRTYSVRNKFPREGELLLGFALSFLNILYVQVVVAPDGTIVHLKGAIDTERHHSVAEPDSRPSTGVHGAEATL
ncbi:hypothetical protein EYF80_019336 [Liparis tanakae]|uniref:Uncharacterized protein n=1 Tax=Liparis tanakae TaxID=230148 RepID=A0A4Z2HX93_9TELE|nr:hypothetical protein EYF80_019336 [Liparis tanakae]